MLLLIIHMFYDHFGCYRDDLKIWILDKFLDLFFQFDLYAGRLIREYIRYVEKHFFQKSEFFQRFYEKDPLIDRDESPWKG